MQGIKVSTHFVGARLDIALITIVGYVDTATCHELTKLIRDLVSQKRIQIIADLGGVSYISSAGWGVFVGEIKNIRDLGGDFKVVQMTPEVYEVFEMLEFNKILNTYESLEEAIDEFDLIRGVDITKPEPVAQRVAVDLPAGRIAPRGKGSKEIYPSKSKLTVQDYPLVEKVKMVVLENPFGTNKEIRRQLNTEKYGNVKVGWFRLRLILKKLSLDNKEKRYRYYRSR